MAKAYTRRPHFRTVKKKTGGGTTTRTVSVKGNRVRRTTKRK